MKIYQQLRLLTNTIDYCDSAKMFVCVAPINTSLIRCATPAQLPQELPPQPTENATGRNNFCRQSPNCKKHTIAILPHACDNACGFIHE